MTKKGLLGGTYYQEVSGSNSCDHFIAKFTAENSNFKGGSSCFLTSACVDYLGKEDDCEELTKLRIFRDSYIRGLENGDSLIKEYYDIAPSIVEKINNSDKKEEYYQYIYGIIKSCIKTIDASKNEETLEQYKNMVVYLKEKLL